MIMPGNGAVRLAWRVTIVTSFVDGTASYGFDDPKDSVYEPEKRNSLEDPSPIPDLGFQAPFGQFLLKSASQLLPQFRRFGRKFRRQFLEYGSCLSGLIGVENEDLCQFDSDQNGFVGRDSPQEHDH